MKEYTIVYGDGDPAAFGTETFEAQGMDDALYHIALKHSRSPVDLWCEGVFVARLEHISNKDGSFWRVTKTGD